MDAPTAQRWQAVRNRIHRIHSDMEAIHSELNDPENTGANEVLRRLEALQEKFEKVMGQLAVFDDERDESVRQAKDEFRRIVREYKTSRTPTRKSGVH